jgi:hypothetical protein
LPEVIDIEVDFPVGARRCTDSHVTLRFYARVFERLALKASRPKDVFLEAAM